MSSQARIRAAGPAETDAVIALYDWLFDPPGGPPPDWDPAAAGERLRAAITRDGSTVLVADAGGGELIGFCTAYMDLLSVRYGQRCWVEDLAVDPERRGRGLGRELLNKVLAEAARMGVRRATLEVRRSNTAAQRLYAAAGFTVAAVRSSYYTQPIEDALVLAAAVESPAGGW